MEICKVSVLMPVFNSAPFLRDSIDSILNQTFQDFEFVIINDGSTDQSEEIILSYHDNRIRYLKNEENIGLIKTLNRGLDIIKSEYIIRMDSDDISFPHRFQTQVDYMDRNPNMVVSGSSKQHFSGDTIVKHEVRSSVEEENILFKSIFNTSMPHPTIIIRNEVIQKYNIRYNKAYIGAEDKAMWLEMAQYGKLGKITEPLIKYRVHENQITSKKLVECRKNSVAITIKYLSGLGISIDEQEEKVLSFICYPNKCGNMQIAMAALKLANKLSDELKKHTIFNSTYIDKFFNTRILNILVKSTSIGLPLIGIILKNQRLKFKHFNLMFYRNILLKQ